MPNEDQFDGCAPSPNSSSSSSSTSTVSSASAVTNPKVPIIRIIFSQNQNNAVVNNSDDFVGKEVDDPTGDPRCESINKDPQISEGVSSKGPAGKRSRNGNNRQESETDNSMSVRTENSTSSTSSSSTTSDRSSSTSPTSESESLASNSTIISENPQRHQTNPFKVKTEVKDDNSNGKHDRGLRNISKNSTECKVSKRLAQDSGSDCGDQSSSISNTTTSNTPKEQHTTNSNQRITRSSQRAAQQNKGADPSSDQSVNEEPQTQEIQEKAPESTRKVKRRKGEPQEAETETNQPTNQTSLYTANIYPADYQLPPQNSFQLYKSLRSKPHQKLWTLSHAPPKAPHGFKNYLLSGGPYLLDGNKLGSGVIGSIYENSNEGHGHLARVSRQSLSTRLSKKAVNYHSSQQRHMEYPIPKLGEAPKSLLMGSPLYELFLDQEKARYQMKMQHVKERERSILAIEQEVLRAYNRAAIADMRQDTHLSACTYFYYQERYHYIDEKLDSLDGNIAHNSSQNSAILASQEQVHNSSELRDTPKETNAEGSSDMEVQESPSLNPSDQVSGVKRQIKTDSEQIDEDRTSNTNRQQISKFSDREKMVSNSSETKVIEESSRESEVENDGNGTEPKKHSSAASDGDDVSFLKTNSLELAYQEGVKTEGHINRSDVSIATTIGEIEPDNAKLSSETEAIAVKDAKSSNVTISDEELKVFNRAVFVNQLQDIDDKWESIKKEMCIRHRNEADSLYAIQSLEWEWRAKEVGLVDSRSTYKVEQEYVPRIEVKAIDY